MPTTYLLLRNNKQTGPFQLDALLQQGLQPLDLIWVEGQSAGWCHPTEITALRPYVSGQKEGAPWQQDADTTALPKPVPDKTPPSIKKPSHIYVSLPAAMQPPPAAEAPPRDALEAKAEALHQRIQAFAEGKATPDNANLPPTRSLDNIKLEFGAWQAKLKKKKKQNIAKRRFLIAGAALIVAASAYGLSKWVQRKPQMLEPQLTGYAVDPVAHEPAQTTTASFHSIPDSFLISPGETHTLPPDTIVKQKTSPNNAGVVATPKKKEPEKNRSPIPQQDTIEATETSAPAPVPENKSLPEEVKKVVPLSRLVFVTGTLPNNKRGDNAAALQVTLQNNSSEMLKSVAVVVTYFKKEARQLGKETVYFYNVEPNSAPVLTTTGNRRATNARFELGTITRADGSIYLIK